MKYSRKRCRKGHKKQEVDILVKTLSLLNPSVTFRKADNNTIISNLSGSKLRDIKIPSNAKFLNDKDESCIYGFICILYDSKEFIITSDAYDNADCLLAA